MLFTLRAWFAQSNRENMRQAKRQILSNLLPIGLLSAMDGMMLHSIPALATFFNSSKNSRPTPSPQTRLGPISTRRIRFWAKKSTCSIHRSMNQRRLSRRSPTPTSCTKRINWTAAASVVSTNHWRSGENNWKRACPRSKRKSTSARSTTSRLSKLLRKSRIHTSIGPVWSPKRNEPSSKQSQRKSSSARTRYPSPSATCPLVEIWQKVWRRGRDSNPRYRL